MEEQTAIVEQPVKPKRRIADPTHQEFDWFDKHVGLGYSQQQIAEESGVEYEEVVKAVRYVGRWMRRNYTDAKKYEVSRSKNLYRLEKVIVNLMRQFEESSDVQAAKEVRMCIHEWMEITGGLEPKRIETTSQATVLQINGTIDKMLNSNAPINPKILEAAQKIRHIESQVVDVA